MLKAVKALFFCVLLGLGLAPAAWAHEPPSAEAFARIAAISSVSISPDGRHVAAVVSLDGAVSAVAIWRTDALDSAPIMVGTEARSQIQSVSFAANDRLFVTTQQLVEHNPFSGRAERSFGYRRQILDLEGNVVRTSLRFDGLTPAQQAFVGIGTLVSLLPNDPEHILVSSPMSRDIYRLNLYTGRAGRVERGSTRFTSPRADLFGEIRSVQNFDFDSGAAYIGVWLKHPDSGQMEEHFRWYARDREPVSIAAFTTDPNIVLINTTDGRDHAAIVEYHIRERQMGEIAFAHPLFDASGVALSRAAADYGEILGFSYQGERSRMFWVDPVMEEVERQMRVALGVQMTEVRWTDIASGQTMSFDVPDGADITITDWSDNRDRFIVRRSGGSTPPEFYVVANNRVQLLGRAYPELQGAPLGRVQLVQYAARDGLQIPAILTTPDPEIFGPGPWPSIVTPHGGPWARDNLDWDSSGWTQYFAARGYAVLQPQFRGSQGWGQRLWRAGDREWGRAMQDDKDDGALWMIAQGIAAEGQIAMHGYSYGGYAAMMAAARSDGLYRCAAAGAGLATIDLFRRSTYNNRFLREFQHPTADGEDPLSYVSNVSIPVLLYTGDRDTVVPPSESQSFASALRRAGKQVDIVILPDMEHSINTWNPANFAAILTTVENFLNTSCQMPAR